MTGGAPTAFTLIELLVSMVVLTLLVALIGQLFNQAASVVSLGNKRADADSQARVLLDRMAVDFDRMLKRADVDYYLKGRPSANNQSGNDQIAFYSEVSGYFASTGTPSPVSLVAYRINNQFGSIGLERLGKGLVWNGVSPDPDASNGTGTTNIPLVFLPIPLASPLPSPLPSPMPATVPDPAWPQAANMSKDEDYELAGPQVFRFEYYYVLKGQTASPAAVPSILSDVPWDTRAPANHTAVNGLADVAAIGVAIAVVDPKSRSLVTDSQLVTLAAQLKDFDPTAMQKIGDMEAQWNAAILSSNLPRLSVSAMRVYGRCFYLTSPTQ